MPVNITDVDEFTSPITAPAGTDVANAASVVQVAQKLANRTHNLNERLSTIETHVRPDIITTRRAYAGASQAVSAWDATSEYPHWQLDAGGSATWARMRSEVSGAVLHWTFAPGANLPFSCIVDHVRVRVIQGSAYGVGDRMKARVSYIDRSSWAPVIVDTVEAGAGTAGQAIDVPISPGITLTAADVAIDAFTLGVTLFGGIGSPPMNDFAIVCEVSFETLIF